MTVEEKVRQFKMQIDTAAKEGLRIANLSIVHEARKLSVDAGTGKTWYQVDIWLEGPDGLRNDVRSVDYELHPTFNPQEVSRTTPPRFPLQLRVWGEFTIRASVNFKDGSSARLARYLSLPR